MPKVNKADNISKGSARHGFRCRFCSKSDLSTAAARGSHESRAHNKEFKAAKLTAAEAWREGERKGSKFAGVKGERLLNIKDVVNPPAKEPTAERSPSELMILNFVASVTVRKQEVEKELGRVEGLKVELASINDVLAAAHSALMSLEERS